MLTSTHMAFATAMSLRTGGSFTDSKSFLQALEARKPNDLGTVLVDPLLGDRLSYSVPPPPRLICIRT